MVRKWNKRTSVGFLLALTMNPFFPRYVAGLAVASLPRYHVMSVSMTSLMIMPPGLLGTKYSFCPDGISAMIQISSRKRAG
jgi:hypothetical protein